MQPNGDSWEINHVPKPPEWIWPIEKQLSDAINESMIGGNTISS